MLSSSASSTRSSSTFITGLRPGASSRTSRVRRADDARDGEIVVALAGDDETVEDATVKRFFREDGRVRLQPENSEFEPIYAAHVQVIGKVIGVFRAL